MKNENYLVAVKPTKPLTGVNCAEGTPELKQSSVAPAHTEGGGERERERERGRLI